jgi:hypothetical protein
MSGKDRNGYQVVNEKLVQGQVNGEDNQVVQNFTNVYGYDTQQKQLQAKQSERFTLTLLRSILLFPLLLLHGPIQGILGLLATLCFFLGILVLIHGDGIVAIFCF